MTDDLLATPWGQAPLLDLDVPALLPTQRTSPRPGAGPWGDHPLPVPVPSWSLREQRSAELREQRSAELREQRGE
ncbi:MAG TPA: hypothetical protein VFS29_00645 [Motilibacteraceae bacterium]|nr:hypothetical protein [Motilibacteraceae bacterium]